MKRAEHQPISGELVIYAGIYCKLYTVPDTGTVLPQHSHRWDHLTILLKGAVTVFCDGALSGEYRAPATIKIPAFALHTFHTRAPDCVLACIHNADHAEADGEPPIHAEHYLPLED